MCLLSVFYTLDPECLECVTEQRSYCVFIVRFKYHLVVPEPQQVMFEPGEVVRITDGPFNDFNGVVETVDFEKNKLKVSVLVFGKPTPIELSLTQVEKG